MITEFCNNPKNGDLIVWWIPQVPMKPFYYPVNSPQEAFVLLDALAKYDLFQLENNIKPDYSNAGGLMIFNDDFVENEDLDDFEFPDNGWIDWECDCSCENIDYYLNLKDGYIKLIEDLKI